MVYGYIRVSTREQNEERQRLAMLDAGIPEKHIVLDKQSGKNFNRPGYRQICKIMKPGGYPVHQEYRPVGTKLR